MNANKVRSDTLQSAKPKILPENEPAKAEEGCDGEMSVLKWVENHGEYESFYKGYWGFVKPDPPNWYRAFDARFSRAEFGTGFLGIFPTLDAAERAIEKRWGIEEKQPLGGPAVVAGGGN